LSAVGIVPNGEIGIHRTSDKTIEFFGQYGVVRQKANLPLDISALVSVDGTNNFRDRYVPALGAILSRRFGARAALYVEPTWVHHSNVQPSSGAEADDTFMVVSALGYPGAVNPLRRSPNPLRAFRASVQG
jgi:hypothetical protein